MWKPVKETNPQKPIAEISENPHILFDTKISGNQLFFFGIQLGDTVEKIRIEDIRTTSMERIPESANSSSYHDGKTFYIVYGKEIEFTLPDRIGSVIENNGWLHMKTGAKYRIRDRTILFVSSVGILLGLKFRSTGYKILVLILSLGTSVLSYFCFRHEMNFPIIGSLFLVESFVGFAILFVHKH